MSSATSGSSSVVVFKNLPLESTVADLEEALKRLEIVYTSIDRKVDSLGEFKGTAFVRCSGPEMTDKLLELLKLSEVQLHGRKLKAEILRRGGPEKSLNAKKVLDGEILDAKATRVRDLIASFVYSDRQELMLPIDFTGDQRKLAHALAEKFNLVHATVSGNGTSLNSATSDGKRAVLLTKNRGKSSPSSSIRLLPPPPTREDHHARTMASMMAAAATNDLAHIRPLLPHAAPEVAVFAAPMEEPVPMHAHVFDNMDQVAIMHAAKAQMHAEAARSALQASKASKAVGAIPAWLEIVPPKPAGHSRGLRNKAGTSLNANAPEFVPSASLMGPPPGLSPKTN